MTTTTMLSEREILSLVEPLLPNGVGIKCVISTTNPKRLCLEQLVSEGGRGKRGGRNAGEGEDGNDEDDEDDEEDEDFLSPLSPLRRLESDFNANLTEFVTVKCR